MNNQNVFKICFIGDGGVGKTTLVKRFLTGEFETKYVATLGVESHPINFTTNLGEVRFNVWDTAGQEKFGGLRDGYYIEAKGAVAMFDLTSRVTFKDVDRWIADFKRVCPNAPIVLVGCKSDLNPTRVSAKEIHKYINEKGLRYYEISNKNSQNLYKPFLYLGKEFVSEDLEFN